MTKPKRALNCDVCGHSMKDPKIGTTVSALYISLTGAKEVSEVKRVKKIFGKTEFNICYVCWLDSLKVPRV